jgi:pimeloyl-ACP methyl ester carboxylesterase
MDDPAAGAEDYVAVALRAIEAAGFGGDTVVVGHSMAGQMLPVLAARSKVGQLVFLAANVPVPGISYNDYLESQPGAIIVPWDLLEYDDADRIVVSWELARSTYYPDVEEGLARDAHAHLTPMALTVLAEPCPIDSWPTVPCTYILASEDRVIGRDWARRVCGERLGISPIEISSSHSPFLSQPEALAKILDGIAAKAGPS